MVFRPLWTDVPYATDLVVYSDLDIATATGTAATCV
jgi:hypothetical protein